ncbi:MAG TPA: hypothetical protein VGE74_14495 [Gemmata sp.]
MPLVVCPGCSAKLNAPENAAGKKVRCPKCQTVVPVPAPVAELEVPELEPLPIEPDPPEPMRPAKAPPQPVRNADDEDGDDRPRKRRREERDDDRPGKRRPDDETEDDDRPRKGGKSAQKSEPGRNTDARPRARRRTDEDDEGDDRPRKKGTPAQKGGAVLVVLLCGGLAAAVLAGGLAVYWFGFRERADGEPVVQNGSGETPGPVGPAEPGGAGNVRSDPPAGWKEFTSERDEFKAYFAGDPETGATVKSSRPVAGGQVFYRAYSYRSHPSWADLALTVRVFEFPKNSTPQQQQAFADQVCTPSQAETGETVSSRGATTLAGVEGKEAVGEAKVGKPGAGTTADGRPMPSKLVSVNRWIVANNKCYHLKIQGHNAPPKDAGAFFDNFALTNAPAPKPKGGDNTPAPTGPKPAAPAGWVAYKPAGVGFQTVVPIEPKVSDATTKLPSKFGQPMLQSVTLHRSTDAAGVVYEARVVQFSSVVKSGADQINAIHDVAYAPVFEKFVRGGGGSRSLTWAGKPANEWTFASGQGVARETHTATGGIMAAVYAPKGAQPDPEKVRAFLDSFEFAN